MADMAAASLQSSEVRRTSSKLVVAVVVAAHKAQAQVAQAAQAVALRP
jgi:hypothetical protein